MAADDWKDCDLVEILPGKHSGDPVFKNTRLPLDEADAIRAVLNYRAEMCRVLCGAIYFGMR
jgi:uncharacterized protein (DUF433 family)